MQPSSPVSLYINSQAGDVKFKVYWQGNRNHWDFKRNGDIPFPICQQAIENMLNAKGGTAFLCPSLSKALGFEINPSQVTHNIAVQKIQEGLDSGIFKVTAEVNCQGESRPVSFCLVVSRGTYKNELHKQIPKHLNHLRKQQPDYVVRPFFIGTAQANYQGGQIPLVMYSTEWLENHIEVNMRNATEVIILPGLEEVGLRGLVFNSEAHPINTFVPDNLAEAIATEMVKILTLFFDPQTGEHIGKYGINAGDFVSHAQPNGAFSLKLVTCRAINNFPKENIPIELTIYHYIYSLLTGKENSLCYPISIYTEAVVQKYSIYPFTPQNICQGIIKALIAKLGPEKGLEEAIKWLAIYLGFFKSHPPDGLYHNQNLMLRLIMAQQQIEKSLADLGIEVSIEIVEPA